MLEFFFKHFKLFLCCTSSNVIRTFPHAMISKLKDITLKKLKRNPWIRKNYSIRLACKLTYVISLQVTITPLYWNCFEYNFIIVQGYPSELLPLMVAGVPSMHICLDFIPELLGQPQVEKQVKIFSKIFAYTL